MSINGQDLSTGGSATVAIPSSGTTDIVVEIGTKTYTLTILRNSGTGGEATSYTLTFDTNGGSAIAPITQDYGTAITAPADPTKTGYTFAGWTPAIPATMPAENMTIKAKWTVNQYTLTFGTNGGSTIAPITQDYGTAITAPADPTKTGYTFAGWTPAIPTTMPAENMTIKAKWTANQYTLTFDTNGGSTIAPITQDYGTAITAPADPTKTGYTFAGWTPAIPATMPAENMTIKAKWTVNQYTLTFDTNGGSTIAPITQDYGTAITAPADPTKTGYTFAGWTPAIPSTMPAENLTVTAQWRYNGGGSSGYSYYTIKATAGTGGSISPSGNISVREGRDQTFTITPDKGYAVANVKIDGKSIGAVKSYTFENVRRTHTIEVIFMKANGNPQTGVFVDVAEGSYYEEAIDWAVEKGITNGVSSNMFAPNDPCTRAQIVTFLWRAAGSPAPKSISSFTDVPADAFYAKAVAWAVENGITSGTGESKFSPNATCTRAQAVTFLYRASGSPAVSGSAEFSDVSATAFYADAVAWAAKKGITTGIGGGLFGADNDCTRGQIVTFLWRCKK